MRKTVFFDFSVHIRFTQGCYHLICKEDRANGQGSEAFSPLSAKAELLLVTDLPPFPFINMNSTDPFHKFYRLRPIGFAKPWVLFLFMRLCKMHKSGLKNRLNFYTGGFVQFIFDSFSDVILNTSNKEYI